MDMKKITKLLILFCLIAPAFECIAQTYWVRGGLNLSNMLIKDDNGTYSDDFTMQPGFHVGLTGEFPITDMISFETGVLISTKGFKQKEEATISGVTISAKQSLRLTYVDIPLTAKIYIGSNEPKVFALGGVYLGMGLGGKNKAESSAQGVTQSEELSINWGSKSDDDLRGLDYGFAVGAGVEFGVFQANLIYNLGLANIAAEQDGGTKINNRVLRLSVGYLFTGK